MSGLSWRKTGRIGIGMFRAGMLGFGGGPSSIPLVYKEAVERYRWLTDDEYADILALANALPGPILTKLAGYIGYRQAGLAGLATAIVAVTLPTVVMMVALIGFIFAYRETAGFAGMLAAIGPIVGVMLLQLTWSFLKQSARGLGWKWTAILCAAGLLLYQVLHVHPAFLIAVSLGCGLLGTKPLNARSAKQDDNNAKST